MSATVRARLAIVGSVQFAHDMPAWEWAEEVIRQRLVALSPELVISGGAAGIDTLGVRQARIRGIPVREHFPKANRWAPSGYKERNLLIAEDCTHLLCIRHPMSKTYGSGWTADTAENLGKTVERLVFPSGEVEA